MTTSRKKVVVLGSGMAGASFVAALLQHAPADAFEIAVVGAEPDGAYDRFDLGRVLRGDARPDEIVRFSPAWFEAQGVKFYAGVRASLVDRLRRLVHTDELALPYDRLIFATGSTPYFPRIKNLLVQDSALHPGVFTFHTLADCNALVRVLEGPRRIAVLGGGPAGLELAGALSRRGAEVHLFHLAQRLMNGQLDDGAARILCAALDALGARVHFGKSACALHGEDRLEAIEFRDGSTLPFDAMVVAAGLQPDTWLAYQSGLSVERAIVVEGHLRSTDDFDVYALGECAQWRGSMYGSLEQIGAQAEVIAEHLTIGHHGRRYVSAKQAAQYRVLGLEIATMGDPETRTAEDDVAQLSEPGQSRYKKVVLRKGRLVNAILLGDLRQARNLSQLYGASAPLSTENQSQLFDLPVPDPKLDSAG